MSDSFAVGPLAAQAESSLAWSRRLAVPSYLLITVALLAALFYAETEREMGTVQRIFYFHVAAAWNAFLAFFLVGVAGIVYLRKRRLYWDQFAASSVEVGLLFTTVVLLTGPMWARPAWGTWLPWGDPRVMTTMVMWLMYAAYLILRSGLPEGHKRYRFAAVYGIICFVNVPIVYKSIDWWRTMHPNVLTSSGGGLEPRMWQSLGISVIAFTVLLMTLVLLRCSMRLNQLAADKLLYSEQD